MKNLEKKVKIKTNKGITLIALVITIIVLLILAAISIATLTGDNGILTKANNAKTQNTQGEEKEQIGLAYDAVMADNYEAGNYNAGVTATQLQEHLTKQNVKATATGEADSNSITVEFADSGNSYTVDGKTGEITGPTTGTEPTVVPTTVAEAKESEYVFKGTDNRTITDDYGNSVVIPEGFKIAKDSGTNIKEGIVVEDVDNEKTAGSQFVWIPVGKVYKNAQKETETITLSRYTFSDGYDGKTEGTPIEQGNVSITSDIDNFTENLTGNTEASIKNAVADEEVFKAFTNASDNGTRKSVEEVGGYYIGRYEARTNEPLSARNDDDDTLPQLTEKADESVYIYAKQPQASKLCKEMYQEKSFKSDLMNSYAWDTAIVYIQKISEDPDYSRQNSLNTNSNGGFAEKGTNNPESSVHDEVCKIYDMASNCYEWTTETFSYTGKPCTNRGGGYNSSNFYTSRRVYDNATNGYGSISFRPLLIM